MRTPAFLPLTLAVTVLWGGAACIVLWQGFPAKGVVQACETVDVKVPLVVRLAGTNVEEGRKILAESGLKLITADTLAEAAEKAVAACQGSPRVAA